jgi:3-oxoacyl-[acyl-carrier protein] reductase/pyridoxal 4-dehydrogenase
VGGNKYLTNATTLVNTAELRHAKVPEPFEHLGYSDLSFDFPGTIVPFVPWEELDFAEWRRVMSVNIDGVFLTCKAVYPYMKEAGYGRIVNICSNVVTAGTPNMAHYVASKGAVFSFTRSLATEVGQYGITVNAVAPGLTASEGVLESPHAGAFDFVVSLQSIPRRGVPDDIAPAVAFLASEEAHWITGQMLTADGGHTRH